MPNCYFFPGFCGSELWSNAPPPGGNHVWANYGKLFLGFLGSLRLAPDGVSPAPPDGHPCFDGPLLDSYYGPALRALAVHPLMQSYTIHPQHYDWRSDFLGQRPPAIQHIIDHVSPADPCALVGHSFGGLIARIVWSKLNALGKGNLVRRLVSLGTPHYGSYQALRVLSDDDDTVSQLTILTGLAAAARNYLEDPDQSAVQDPLWIISLFCTFPSIYDSFPIPGAPDAGNDPLRAALYVPSNYHFAPVQQRWLTESLEVNGPWLLSPANVPPADVFTAIGGTDFPTVDQLRLATPLGNPGVYNTGSAGDGVVTLASAIGPARRAYVVHQRHNDLPLATTLSGLLPAAITETDPPPPSPEQFVQNDRAQPILGGPPFPPLQFGRTAPAGPMVGGC